MKILYIITILSLYITFLLINKSEKKQNLIKWLCITCILTLCYNILICLILTLIGILCTLQNLAICNVIVTVILIAIILKTKTIQKYEIKLLDICSCIIIFVIAILVAYKLYGIPLNINYTSTDGASHYFYAEQFYKNSTLLYNQVTDDYLGIYNGSFRLPGAYINEGILFKIFDNIALKTDLYILFDVFILYLSGMLFYFLLKKYAKESKTLCVLALIFSIIYMLGYQLNSMISGFVYLSLALDIIITFLLLITNYKKDEIPVKIALPILSLVSFGIFFSYAYFIPIIYISIVIYIIKEAKREKEKIVSTKNILQLIYLIIIPSMLGISYFIIFPLINGLKTEISTINAEGAIYKNYITNFLIFISTYIMCVVLKAKNSDENHFETILFILSILFAIILFIGYKIQIVSKYYFFKAYYMIWILAICNCYLAIVALRNKNKAIKNFTNSYIIIYIVAIIFSTLILNKNIAINSIFSQNLQDIKYGTYILKNEELQIINKIETQISSDKTYVLTPGTIGREDWMSILLNSQYIYIDAITNYKVSIEKWLEEKDEEYYFAYYEDYKQITDEKINLDENSNKYEIIYNDEYGFLLKKK